MATCGRDRSSSKTELGLQTMLAHERTHLVRCVLSFARRMPDRNNTNRVQRRRFPPEPRHSPCQYERVLAAPTSLLSQKSAGAELLAPQSKRFSDDVASGSPQSGAARNPRRKISGEVIASTICEGKEPQALMRAPCIYARCRELCLAATQRRQ